MLTSSAGINSNIESGQTIGMSPQKLRQSVTITSETGNAATKNTEPEQAETIRESAEVSSPR